MLRVLLVEQLTSIVALADRLRLSSGAEREALLAELTRRAAAVAVVVDNIVAPALRHARARMPLRSICAYAAYRRAVALLLLIQPHDVAFEKAFSIVYSGIMAMRIIGQPAVDRALALVDAIDQQGHLCEETKRVLDRATGGPNPLDLTPAVGLLRQAADVLLRQARTDMDPSSPGGPNS